jgi:tRNA nucleotidyltransferase (CCA-adding enzyme)
MFATCTLTLKNKLKVDFATARRETYEHPAALPKIEPSSLKDDLARRDFTINAMAMSLNKKDFGRLIDFFGGKKDLVKGIIRAMHDESFIDDPTRIFRAVRFEERFGFAIDKHTLKLIESAIKKGMLAKLSKYRIEKELKLMGKLGAGNIKAFEL